MEAAKRRHESRQRRNGMRGGSCGEKQTKKRRRRCLLVIGLVVIALVAIITGVTVGVAKKKAGVRRAERSSLSSPEAEAETEAADWGGLPPIPLGTVLVRPFVAAELLTTCAAPPQLWSCSLPPDTKFPATTAINSGARVPEFRFTIKRRRPSQGGPESAWMPVPASVPNATDYASVASVDGVADAGQDTELYISLATVASDSGGSGGGGSTGAEAALRESPQATGGVMVRPESHMLPSALMNQPLRLFNRGRDNEHYGFHVYFDKTVQFANNTSGDNGSSGPRGARDTGGVSAAESQYRIRWVNTRFRVAIFTSKGGGRKVQTASASEADHPVDIWEDRADGLQGRDGRVIMALPLDKDGVPGRPTGIVEKHGIGTDRRGCFCHWSNFSVDGGT